MTVTNPFQIRKLEGPSLLQRLLRRTRKRDAPAEVNNLLSRAASVREVSQEDVERIAERYEVAITSKFTRELRELYRTYLEHCLRDYDLTSDDVSDLTHLKRLFDLQDKDLQLIHDEVSIAVYGKTIDWALSGGLVNVHERQSLERLQKQLKLPDELAKSLYDQKVENFLQRRLELATHDERLSPAEDKELEELAHSLNAMIQTDDHTKVALERFRLYWLIENGQIPSINVGINLGKKEKCYFEIPASLFEPRVITRGIRYSGLTGRVRIMKGLYWRTGYMGFQPNSEELMRQIDTGRLFLTNRRLIFMGSRRNTSIRLGRILGFTPYSDGFLIQKDAGRSPLFQFSGDGELFSMMLDRALRDAA